MLWISLCTRHPSAAPLISSGSAGPREPGLVDIGDVLRGLPVWSGSSREARLVGCSEGRQSRGAAGVWRFINVAAGWRATTAWSLLQVHTLTTSIQGERFFPVYFQLMCRENETQFETTFVSFVLSRPQGQRRANSPKPSHYVWIPALFRNLLIQQSPIYLLLMGQLMLCSSTWFTCSHRH